MAAKVDAIYRVEVPQPTAVLTYHFQGRGFGHYITGRTPRMPVSIKDTDQGWKVSVGDLKDAEGEPVDIGTVDIVFAVDAPVVAIVDNGDGSATFGSGVTDGSVPLPASANLTATVTPKDGSPAFPLTDVITVVASDAVSGDFVYVAPGA